MTHITYKTAKRIKEFLGESAPEPMLNWYMRESVNPLLKDMPIVLEIGPRYPPDRKSVPAYQLHDLLSKPFCEACAEHHPHKEDMGPLKEVAWELAVMITELFYSGGLPAVETALMEMMEAK